MGLLGVVLLFIADKGVWAVLGVLSDQDRKDLAETGHLSFQEIVEVGLGFQVF